MHSYVACIGDSRAVDIILDSINQVLTLHTKFPTPFVHIGADEAFQVGVCEADKKILPVKYGNDSRKLVFDHIKTLAKNITGSHPRTQVLLWFDEFKSIPPFLVKEYGLDKLVTPVVWKYTGDLDKDLPPELWTNLSVSFSSIWGGSAFKGINS
uniref:Beta-N-acetylhexosaminidase n=1 Tax=Heterorhabditis bacteriophora TaxID=37862 RepID=A0A1I7XMM9_HETBA